jgi:hypothetical protein
MIFQEPKQYSLEKSGKMENSQLCLTKTQEIIMKKENQKKKKLILRKKFVFH